MFLDFWKKPNYLLFFLKNKIHNHLSVITVLHFLILIKSQVQFLSVGETGAECDLQVHFEELYLAVFDGITGAVLK